MQWAGSVTGWNQCCNFLTATWNICKISSAMRLIHEECNSLPQTTFSWHHWFICDYLFVYIYLIHCLVVLITVQITACRSNLNSLEPGYPHLTMTHTRTQVLHLIGFNRLRLHCNSVKISCLVSKWIKAIMTNTWRAETGAQFHYWYTAVSTFILMQMQDTSLLLLKETC